MENTLSFVRDNTYYYFVGQPSDYYYDLGYVPLDSLPCNDILEKTRFLYALWEIFIGIDTSPQDKLITKDLLIDLRNYFVQYDAFDLSHWSLLEFETLEKVDTCSCTFEFDNVSKNIELYTTGIKIVIPAPYENLIGEDADGNLYEIDETNYSEYKVLTFSEDSDFPLLFMSQQQKLDNEINIEKYFKEIISIFKKYEYKISSCEDLLNFYNLNF